MAEIAASGMTPDQTALVMELTAALGQPVRTARQDRNARYYRARKERLNSDDSDALRRFKTLSDASPSSLNDGSTLPVTVEDNLNPPKEKDPKGSTKKVQNRWPEGSFERIWAAFSHKVGKKAVYAKLAKIERSGEATSEEILDGIERYKLAKPEHHDWANPLTWLNQGRWSDEYGTPAATGPPMNGHHAPIPFPRRQEPFHVQTAKPSVLDVLKSRIAAREAG